MATGSVFRNQSERSAAWLLLGSLAVGCGAGDGASDDQAAPRPPSGVEFGGETPDGRPLAAQSEDEWLPGGETTNSLLTGDKVFTLPAANLEGEERDPFFTGNALFNQAWVEAPSSTTGRDGVGPTFNARSCSQCHFKDGRGRPPEADEPLESMLFRLSVPGDGPHGSPKPEDNYGGQLQPFAVDGVAGEASVHIEYTERRGEFADGTGYRLRTPDYEFTDWAYGSPDADLLFSPRVGPQVIGMGLLEAIEPERLSALEDPDDADDDGISGAANRVWDVRQEKKATGRFGWKAEQPSVAQQVAGAFLGDMGITSPLFPEENCPSVQTDCQAAESGGEPEIEAELFDKVVFYTQVLAPPARMNASDEEVLRGKWLFHEAGCQSCHTPSHRTGEHSVSQLEDQLIWPYTDLLLHDMGDGLSDERPSFDASGNEWRTPPLWGIGHFQAVNGHLLLLHDGRARGVAEAILWHGGEGERSRAAFEEMDEQDRKALVRFVESL